LALLVFVLSFLAAIPAGFLAILVAFVVLFLIAIVFTFREKRWAYMLAPRDRYRPRLALLPEHCHKRFESGGQRVLVHDVCPPGLVPCRSILRSGLPEREDGINGEAVPRDGLLERWPGDRRSDRIRDRQPRRGGHRCGCHPQECDGYDRRHRDCVQRFGRGRGTVLPSVLPHHRGTYGELDQQGQYGPLGDVRRQLDRAIRFRSLHDGW